MRVTGLNIVGSVIGASFVVRGNETDTRSLARSSCLTGVGRMLTFDGILVAEKRPEFKYSRQPVLRSSDPFLHDRFLSDHYMIKVSGKDILDDADPG